MSKQTTNDKVEILGVDIDAITQSDAIGYIVESASNPKSKPIYVVKPYVEFLDKAVHNDNIGQLLNNAELVVADGVALVWAAAWLYAGKRSAWRFAKTLTQIVFVPAKLYWPLDKPLAGINFAIPMLEAAAGKQLRVYLVGTLSIDEITHTAETICGQIPNLNIVGVHSGRDTTQPMRKVSDTWVTRLGEQIAASNADLILVGMGFPLQEEVMSVLVGQLEHGVLIGEGGTFDYEQFGGKRAKSPVFMQKIGLEWFWRLLIEPSRWRRQLAVPRFIWRVWRSR
jgi:N-acetylglucosaminyldiphosphoundecaprenol N-acetyl-beta-D-mannosaminyltransferase